MSVRALFVDLDGTLADSLDSLYGVYETFLAAWDRRPSREEFAELNGPPIPEVVRYLRERHGLEAEATALIEQYTALCESAYAAQIPLMPAAEELLRWASEREWEVVLVTSAPRRLASSFLAAHNLEEFFAASVCADDVSHCKPAPEPYLRALSLVGVEPGEAVALEDSASGQASARAVGLDVWPVAGSLRPILLRLEASVVP